MTSVGGLPENPTPSIHSMPGPNKIPEHQREVTQAALDALSNASVSPSNSSSSTSLVDLHATHLDEDPSPSTQVAIGILNPGQASELSPSASEIVEPQTRTPLTEKLAASLSNVPGVFALTGGVEPRVYFTKEDYDAEVVRFAERARQIPKKFIIANHPLLAGEIVLEPVTGSGAKSGVYFAIRIEKNQERTKIGVLKPMDEGFLAPNNPRGEACFADIQVHAGVWNFEPIINGAICYQLAKQYEYTGISAEEDVTKSNNKFCSIQPFILGETLEGSFRKLATDQVFSFLFGGLSEDKRSVIQSAVKKLVKEGSLKEEEFQNLVKQEGISIDPDVLKTVWKILIDAQSGGPLEGLRNRLKHVDELAEVDMSGAVEEKFNAIIAKISPEDFEDILIFNWIIGQQDLNLGGIMCSGDKTFTLDNGSTLGEVHGHFRTCFVALDQHPSYRAEFSQRSRTKCEIKDADISISVTNMQEWGKSKKSRLKSKDRLLLLRDLMKVDGMTPEKFVYFTQLSPIMALKEKRVDITPLFTKNDHGIAEAVFLDIDFSEIEDLDELIFLLTVRGMTLNADCTAKDLYVIPKLESKEVLSHIKAALEFMMSSKGQSRETFMDSKDRFSLLHKLVDTDGMTVEQVQSFMQNPQILFFWDRGIDIIPIFTSGLQEPALQNFFEPRFSIVQQEINSISSEIANEQDDEVKESLNEQLELLEANLRFLRAAHGLMLPQDDDLKNQIKGFSMLDYEYFDDDIVDALVVNSEEKIPNVI